MAVNSQLSEDLAVTCYDFDPDSADATDVGWVDMSGYQKFMAVFVRTDGTSALDTFKILANPASDGSGTDVTIKTHAVANEPDAAGDYIFLECTWDDIADADAATGTARYVSAQCEFATATDEGVVVYIRSNARYGTSGLTAESVA